MGELRIQISNDLHKTLKQLALNKGVTLKTLVIKILQEYVEKRCEKEVLGKRMEGK